MTIRKKILHGVEYFQKGELPQWLIIAGQHGDESGVIHSLRTYLEVAGDRLPDFLCMPVISPSALQAGTRLNAYGHDTNRVFTRHSSDPEVQAAIQIIHGQHFALVLSFHEDPDQEAFYLYDSEVIAPPHLATFRQALRAQGTQLFSGIDDPGDPMLGYTFVDGYASLPTATHPPAQGTFWHYALETNLATREMTIEVPGRVSQKEKDQIVQTFFEMVLRENTHHAYKHFT